MKNTKSNEYTVTYANGKTMVMHNCGGKRFEKVLNDGVRSGLLLSWEPTDREFIKAFTPNKHGEYA
jgi:hypothetical protein